MIGMNKITLNQSTIVQAVQEWMNKRMTVETPTVVRVEAENIGGGSVLFNVITQNKLKKEVARG